MKLKEYIKEDKPREKLQKIGVKNLTDCELLSIILRTGNKNESVNELSNKILKAAESLNKLSDMSLNQLMRIDGIALSKACTILSSFELGFRVMNYHKEKIKFKDSYEIFKYYRYDFIGVKTESIYALYFDTKDNLIKKEEVYKGTIENCAGAFRDLFRIAIIENARYIIVMHNHPSDDITPSAIDKTVTEELCTYGEIIGIKVVDHIIISSEDYYSFYEYKHNIKHKN